MKNPTLVIYRREHFRAAQIVINLRRYLGAKCFAVHVAYVNMDNYGYSAARFFGRINECGVVVFDNKVNSAAYLESFNRLPEKLQKRITEYANEKIDVIRAAIN